MASFMYRYACMGIANVRLKSVPVRRLSSTADVNFSKSLQEEEEKGIIQLFLTIFVCEYIIRFNSYFLTFLLHFR